ncbi:MAG TPA: NAD(P)/FAD-dependent oxidoreductase [Gemmatimonadaceae bacterium]|nr:NAD(P)/FAD-dependent oxidoreductase [Gemmatimonadaceae bacterium]
MPAEGALPRSAEVVVVGGGPAGAATAWWLARAGTDVVVLDKARFPRPKPCSEYMSPQASRLLEEMGVLGEVERAGAAQLAGMVIRAPNGALIRGVFAGAHRWRGHRDRGLSLQRTLLDPILLDAARRAGAHVIEGARVQDVVLDQAGRASGVSLANSDGTTTTLSARLVVGADGLRSVVARRLGLTRMSRFPRRIALVTHYAGIAGMGELGEMHVEREGYLGVADVGNGLANVAVVIPASRADELSTGTEAFLERWIASRPQLRDRFAGATRATPLRTTGPFASRARRAWAPGAALVGDAADFFDPFTGEGIYAALRGGELLAPYAVAALEARSPLGERTALEAYDRARRHEFGGKWLVERMIGTAVAFPALLERAASVLSRRPAMADLLVGVTGDFVPASAVLNPAFLARLLLLP